MCLFVKVLVCQLKFLLVAFLLWAPFDFEMQDSFPFCLKGWGDVKLVLLGWEGTSAGFLCRSGSMGTA